MCIGIVVFRDAGNHRPALESNVGSRRTQASDLVWALRPVCFDVFFRALEDVLGSDLEV